MGSDPMQLTLNSKASTSHRLSSVCSNVSIAQDLPTPHASRSMQMPGRAVAKDQDILAGIFQSVVIEIPRNYVGVQGVRSMGDIAISSSTQVKDAEQIERCVHEAILGEMDQSTTIEFGDGVGEQVVPMSTPSCCSGPLVGTLHPRNMDRYFECDGSSVEISHNLTEPEKAGDEGDYKTACAWDSSNQNRCVSNTRTDRENLNPISATTAPKSLDTMYCRSFELDV